MSAVVTAPSSVVGGEVGHRPHVVALGRGGPVVARAEEADRELGLGLGRRLVYVGAGIGLPAAPSQVTLP